MSLIRLRRPARLLEAFILATILPAAALGWLGWRLIQQDRSLERQRVQDLVESAANAVTAGIERELSAIERDLGVATSPTSKRLAGNLGVMARIDRAGRATMLAGAPLLFAPGVPGVRAEPPDSLWITAERLEFAEHDAVASIAAYRALANSPDPNIRAGALVRLARALRRAGHDDEALSTYATLATLVGATILADPADLMGRWARLDLLTSLKREQQLAMEGVALDADLRQGRWPLDRTTALTYLTGLRRWRSDEDERLLATRVTLSESVEAAWASWHDRLPTRAAIGPPAIQAEPNGVLSVAREQANELLVFVATPSYFSEVWRGLLQAPNIAIALVDDHGRPVLGDIPPASVVASVVKPTSDTRLPWTVRVAATSMPSNIASTGATRRQIIIAVLALLAFLIPATGYLVVRTVHRELALARQQAAFVSAVSHEFRSPLTSLSHLTALLRSDFQPSEERRRQYYDVLALETDRLRRFVETLLDFGRIQVGAARYHLEPVDPVATVGTVVEDFRRHHASGAHDVVFTAARPTPQVSADVEALGRAMWNLLENAAKYSPDGSSIGVAVAQEDGWIAIRVSDRGAGIPPDEQPFIFEQFYRGAAASQSAVKGTGVGLAVVRHIVQGHGGDIRIDSVVGRGSTFSIVLPRQAAESDLSTRGSAALLAKAQSLEPKV